MSQSILKMEQIVKSFGAVNVLKGVDFDLAKGEVHALMAKAFPVCRNFQGCSSPAVIDGEKESGVSISCKTKQRQSSQAADGVSGGV